MEKQKIGPHGQDGNFILSADGQRMGGSVDHDVIARHIDRAIEPPQATQMLSRCQGGPAFSGTEQGIAVGGEILLPLHFSLPDAAAPVQSLENL